MARWTINVDNTPKIWKEIVFKGLVAISLAIRDGLHEVAEAVASHNDQEKP